MMRLSLRGRVVCVVVLSLILGAALCVFVCCGRGTVTSTRVEQAFGGVPNPSGGLLIEPPKSSVPPKTLEITPLERLIISKHIASATQLLQRCETENCTTVYDREYEGLSHRTTLKVEPPTKEQLALIYEEITRGISELQPSGNGEKHFRHAAEHLLHSYTSYLEAQKF